jgi:diguanylate cyclase (GGDEF)-like protein/PAS domain S-box-containing protein
MPQTALIQFIQQSSQAALLIDIDDFSIISCNCASTEILGASQLQISDSPFFVTLSKKTKKFISQNFKVFNSEILLGSRIILIFAELRDGLLIIYLQEKYNLDLPSHYLIEVLDGLEAYVYCKDSEYNYTYANRLVCDLFNAAQSDIIGRGDNAFFDEETAHNIRVKSDALVVKKGECVENEERNLVANENIYRTYLSVKKPLIDHNDDIVGLVGISTDISRYKAIEKEIRSSEQKLTAILDNVAAYIYIRDTKHCFTYTNKMTQTLFQRSASEIEGKTPVDLLGNLNGTEFQRLDIDLYRTKEVIKGIEVFIAGKEVFYYWTVKVPLFDDNGDISGLIGMSVDITEQKKLEQKLEQSNNLLKSKINEITLLQATLWEQATQDPLTQLFNRRYFNEMANKEIIKNERHKKPMALLLLDADFFKQVNDDFGHSIGDKVLVKLSKIMLEQCRRTDIVCRYGGEEFVILMPEVSQHIAMDRAENIRKCYQEEITKLLSRTATVSIGIAMWNKDLVDIEALAKAADQAMYQAKHNGRNQVVIYNSTYLKGDFE